MSIAVQNLTYPTECENFGLWTRRLPKIVLSSIWHQILSRHRPVPGPESNLAATTLQSDCWISRSRSAGVWRGRALEWFRWHLPAPAT